MPEQERIFCAAVHFRDKVYIGVRHYSIRFRIWEELKLPRFELPDAVEGFITNTDRFVTRKEAQQIALAAGQVTTYHEELDSMDFQPGT